MTDNTMTEAPLPQPTTAQIAEQQDLPSPTVENELPSMFVPGSGITSLDIYEITLMQLISITNANLNFEPGTLRGLLMSSDRVAQLSNSAQRFMKQQAQAEPAKHEE